MSEDSRQQILETNKTQANFYNAGEESRITNLPMRIWDFFRRRMYFLMEHADFWGDVNRLHREWVGEIAGKKVLDFGCYDGNPLTMQLARHSGSYLGIDLSEQALQRLMTAFQHWGIEGARVQCVDVLSSDFKESGFDIIYAQGVLHHFNPIDALLPVLHSKLAPGGRIISLDPLQTSILTRSVRILYHPFRSDKDWEWPFRRNIFEKLQQYFEIEHMQGFMGASKWAIPLVFLHKEAAVYLARRLHMRDMRLANDFNRQFWGCLQLAMCLRKRV